MSQYHIVVDRSGERCVFSAGDMDQPQVTLLMEGDRKVVVPRNALVRRENGTYYLPHSLAELQREPTQATWVGTDQPSEAVIPVVEEEVKVGKRWVETGRVRINKVVREEEQKVETSLLKDVVDVRRVPVDRVIDQPAPTRYEGETLVIPVVEEVLVVEKRYLLKEEIHVTRRQVEIPSSQSFPVRREEVTVEHVDPQDQSD